MKALFPILLVTLLFSACKEDKPEIEFDQTAMLTNLSQNVFIPNYTELEVNVSDLQTKWNAFKTNLNTSNLNDLKISFEKAYRSFQKVNYAEFGPAANVSLRNNANTFPADTSTIQSNIQNGNYTINTLSSFQVKGFPAIDYLLYSNDENNTIALFSNANRVKYMDALILDLDANCKTVLSEWKSSYGGIFSTKTGSDVGSSVGILVNAWNQHYERNFRDGKIGIPVGVRSLGVALPEKCEAFYSGISSELALENLIAMEKMYLGIGQDGINRASFDDYLLAIDAAALDNDIKNQFSVAKSKLQELGNPLSEEIKNNQPKVNAAYQELQKLILLIKIEMPSRLGILITYQDNDGD